jgi:hypothetical protein
MSASGDNNTNFGLWEEYDILHLLAELVSPREFPKVGSAKCRFNVGSQIVD